MSKRDDGSQQGWTILSDLHVLGCVRDFLGFFRSWLYAGMVSLHERCCLAVKPLFHLLGGHSLCGGSG